MKGRLGVQKLPHRVVSWLLLPEISKTIGT